MNKKLLIIISSIAAIAAISAAAWFVWKDLGVGSENPIPSNGGSVGGVDYEATTTPNTIGAEKDVEYKSLAAKIASQPIIFKTGVSESSQAKTRASIEDLYGRIKADYNNLGLWIDLGLLRQTAGDYSGAKEAFEFANEVFPKNYVSFQDLGFLYGFYLQNPVESEKYYLKSLENDPTNAQVYLDLTDVYFNFKTGVAKIPEFLSEAMKTVSDSDKLLLMARLGRYYEEIKDYANAIKQYEEILAKDPSNTGLKAEVERLKALL